MKNARHEEILKLIRQYDIETQEELAERLNHLGFQVTQATVSRDIRQLLLQKVPGSNGKMKYSAGSGSGAGVSLKYQRVLKDSFVSMDSSLNILVIHTVSGMAMAAAAALDSMDWHELLGSIAGDDTIMCVIRTVDDMDAVKEKIREIVH